MTSFFKKGILIIYFVFLGQLVKAQTDEIECHKEIHHSLDLFFVDCLGKTEYLSKRDGVKVWVEFQLDYFGGISCCEVRKMTNVDTVMKNQICEFLYSQKFPCLIPLYVNQLHHIDSTRISFTFNPSRYPLSK